MSLKEAETKESKIIYAVVIITAAIGFPLYFILTQSEFITEINLKTIAITVLYVVFVTGVILSVFNVKNKNVTSKEADKKLAVAWGDVERILLYILLVFIAYQAVELLYIYVL